MDMVHVLDQADSALAELESYLAPQGDLARGSPSLAGEVRLLCGRLLSRLGLLGEGLNPPLANGGERVELVEYWRSSKGQGLSRDKAGRMSFRDGPLAKWVLLQEGAKKADLMAWIDQDRGTWWRVPAHP